MRIIVKTRNSRCVIYGTKLPAPRCGGEKVRGVRRKKRVMPCNGLRSHFEVQSLHCGELRETLQQRFVVACRWWP